MKQAEIKDHIIVIAGGLFVRFGYNGVGVDRIIADAGVAKTTLYRHFKTKENLIVAVLSAKDQAYRIGLRQFIENKSSDPLERLMFTFDFIKEWLLEDGSYGCPFQSAASEFSDRRHPIFQEARMHKLLLVAYLEELVRATGLPRPDKLATEINILQEGVVSIAQITGDASIADQAKETARRWIGLWNRF